MTDHPHRRRLRERVAARKAGLPEPGEAPPQSQWRKSLRLAGIAMQLVSFLLLLLEVFALVERGFVGIDHGLLVTYLVVFFTGRVLQMIAGFRRR